MTTFNQIEKFDVGFDFIEGTTNPRRNRDHRAFHTLYNAKKR